MRAIALSIFVVACTGVRPVLGEVGPDVAAAFGTWDSPEPDVRYFGAGCYLVRERVVYACTIDDMPGGQVGCAIEPAPDRGDTITRVTEVTSGGGEPGMAQAGRHPADYHLDHFIDELNARRCHAQIYSRRPSRGFVERRQSSPSST
ncbi:MAG TPA: hypothetical protein VGG74_26345 [Kofleriaceae bacterium]|jgi:hypothetical protein